MDEEVKMDGQEGQDEETVVVPPVADTEGEDMGPAIAADESDDSEEDEEDEADAA